MYDRKYYLIFVLTVMTLLYVLFIIKNDYSTFQTYQFSTSRNTVIDEKVVPIIDYSAILLGEDIHIWMNKPAYSIQKAFGEPIRKDLSMYGYVSWIYQDKPDQYIQFGIRNNRVQMIYAIGNDITIDSVHVGDSYDDVESELLFSKEITYKTEQSFFTFILDDEDLEENPLTNVVDDTFIQCYFDKETNKLSSIRLLTGDILLKHSPYEMKYRGVLPASPQITKNEWKKIERGTEQQIFEITNTLRVHYGKQPLLWEESVREVAYIHSKDMAENNYFSHYGTDGTGLKERLAIKEIYYSLAGENIAAQYTDAPAAVLGWLNSKGHREAMLKDEFTHLGVGVYRLYYTQNFLAKPT